jgi:hypothetical protein
MRAGCRDAGRWRVAGDDRTRGPYRAQAVNRRFQGADARTLALANPHAVAAYGDPIGPTIETRGFGAKAGTTSSTVQFVRDPGLRSTGRSMTP